MWKIYRFSKLSRSKFKQNQRTNKYTNCLRITDDYACLWFRFDLLYHGSMSSNIQKGHSSLWNNKKNGNQIWVFLVSYKTSNYKSNSSDKSSKNHPCFAFSITNYTVFLEKRSFIKLEIPRMNLKEKGRRFAPKRAILL